MFSLGKIKRRVNFALTAVGVRSKGFFTPYDYGKEIEPEIPEYGCVTELFRGLEPSFRNFLEVIAGCEEQFVKSEGGRAAIDWDKGMFGRFDTAVLYAAVKHFAPKRIIEVGSGKSTRVMIRSILDNEIDCMLECIDPQPREEISDLPVSFDRSVLRCSHIDLISELMPGDILFVDSSHTLQQGYDVDIILNRIFPALASGVIVHVHDIFLPYGYPSAWRDYHWNEQQALIGWIVSGYFECLFAAHFVWRNMNEEIERACPRFSINSSAGSLFMRKC